MADDELIGDSDEAQKNDNSQKKAAKHDSGAADLEKVTDYAEEKEISSSDDFSVGIIIYYMRHACCHVNFCTF